MVAIRLIESSDIAAVREQVYAHLSEAARAEYLSSHPAAAARTAAILSGKEGACLVAQSNGKIAGFLMGTLAEPITPEIRYGVIDNIRVIPELRGQGIGSQLVVNFSEWAAKSGATRLSVDVSPRNESALRFYARHGLTPATLILESDLTKKAVA